MEMKSAKEMLLATTSRAVLLEDCVNKTVAAFYKVMEKVAADGFKTHTDELLAYFTLNVKRDEYETVIPAVIKQFEERGYKVSQPYKDGQKRFEGSDTVISVSWGE